MTTPASPVPPPRTTTHDEVSPVATDVVRFMYKNHRGEEQMRYVRPIRIWFGSTAWHPHGQYLLEAFDVVRQATRDFAMSGMMGPWEPAVYFRGEWVPLAYMEHTLKREKDDAAARPAGQPA